MTSGNIAVFDHDVRRYLDWLARPEPRASGSAPTSIEALHDRVKDFLAAKQPGEVDIPRCSTSSGMIREAEAVSGIETLGLPAANAHFLNLPFYQTGKVQKDPIGPADVAIVRPLLEELQPRPDLRRRRPVRSARHAPDVQRGDRPGARAACRGRGPRSGSIAGRGRSGRSPRSTWLVPLSQDELQLKIRRSSSTSPRRTQRPFPGLRRPRVLAAGRGAEQGDRAHPRPARAWRSTSRWKPTWSRTSPAPFRRRHTIGADAVQPFHSLADARQKT